MQGFLVLSDISGYTAFLNASELEHAQAILQSLLELLVKHTHSPLVINKLEGDAIFSYAPQGSFLQSQSLLENFEIAYVAFRQALELMALNTTCTCNACRNIPNLDLKFFVHYGEFLIQELAGHTELTGRDVTLAHRLMKNSIVEITGFRAYAAYTDLAIKALTIDGIEADMTPHKESYEYIGEVELYVADMGKVWRSRRELARLVVDPKQALIIIEHDFPVSQSFLWDYVTRPESRALLMGAIKQTVTEQTNGRTGIGATYHCDHGNRVSHHTVLDWEPFNQYTTRETMLFAGTYGITTYQVTAQPTGSRLKIIGGKTQGPWLTSKLSDIIFKIYGNSIFAKGFSALEDQMKADIAEGKTIKTLAVSIPKTRVVEAIAESLEQ